MTIEREKSNEFSESNIDDSRIFQTLMKQCLFWTRIRDAAYKQVTALGLKDFGEEAALYLAQRPWLALIFVVTAVSVGIPFLIGLLFVFTVVGVSFIGFFLFEGAVLALATAALGGFILAIMATIFVVVIIATILYFGLIEGYNHCFRNTESLSFKKYN